MPNKGNGYRCVVIPELNRDKIQVFIKDSGPGDVVTDFERTVLGHRERNKDPIGNWGEQLLGDLSPGALAVFKAAYTNSVKHHGGRVSTNRLIAALPPPEKAVMKKVCAAADYEIYFAAPAGADVPDVGDDWQSKVLFSTCVTNTLKKCFRGTEAGIVDLVTLLKLLCVNADQLSNAIRVHNVDVDAAFYEHAVAARKKKKVAVGEAINPRTPTKAKINADQEHQHTAEDTAKTTAIAIVIAGVAVLISVYFYVSASGQSKTERAKTKALASKR